MEVEKDKAEKELKELMARFKLRKACPFTATPHTVTRTTPLSPPSPLTLLATLPPPSPPLTTLATPHHPRHPSHHP